MGASFSREVVLVPSAARTTSSTSSDIVVPDRYTACILVLDVTAASGTSPTLNVYVQDAYTGVAAANIEGDQPSGTVAYSDFASFTQVTTATATKMFRWVGGGGTGASSDFAVVSGSLTAGTLRTGPIGRKWRVKWTVGGTPHYTFSVMAQFIS